MRPFLRAFTTQATATALQVSAWILAGGFWNDNGIWLDTAVWKDS